MPGGLIVHEKKKPPGREVSPKWLESTKGARVRVTYSYLIANKNSVGVGWVVRSLTADQQEMSYKCEE